MNAAQPAFTMAAIQALGYVATSEKCNIDSTAMFACGLIEKLTGTFTNYANVQAAWHTIRRRRATVPSQLALQRDVLNAQQKEAVGYCCGLMARFDNKISDAEAKALLEIVEALQIDASS